MIHAILLAMSTVATRTGFRASSEAKCGQGIHSQRGAASAQRTWG